MPKAKTTGPKTDSTANLGFEAKLWLAADTAMRDSAMPPCEAILRSLSEAKDNLRNTFSSAA